MYDRYKDRVQFLAIYVREAHPTDGWRTPGNDRVGIAIQQPTTKEERVGVAQKCCAALEITMPLLVDDLDDRVGHAYSGMPDRMYIIDRNGKVVYKGGRGPFGFKPGEMEQSLLMLLLEQEAASSAVPQGRLPVLPNDQAWKRLGGAPDKASTLPAWARMLADSLPQTTAAVLHLEYLHRARSPLDPVLRGKIRWVAAHANRCLYTRAQAENDLVRAGLRDQDLQVLKGDWNRLPDEEHAILAFARKMTLAAHSVTDDEIKKLIDRHGEKQVVAMVLLLAFANFQDRLILTLGITPDSDSPLPPIELRRDRKTPISKLPRKVPSGAGDYQPPPDPELLLVKFSDLQDRMEDQRARKPRIRIPSWDEVKKGLPRPLNRKKPLEIRWSLVCMGYQPELARAWSDCTGSFNRESGMDLIFEESIFWVVTRSLACFY